MKSFFVWITILASTLFSIQTLNTGNQKRVLTGADALVSSELNLIKGKSLGVITNQTAILNSGIHLVDALLKIPGVKIKMLFSPEHGIRGNAPAGKKLGNAVDSKTGLPVFSLYGKNRKPTKESLQGINLLIFDIQDVGARYYTYISTLYYSLIAAAENNIPIIVLDRPNPINGVSIEGPLLNPKLKSFVGIAPIPIRHGMTIGELARLFNGNFLPGNKKAKLKVVKMKNWKRKEYFDETGLKWISPSPNMTNLETAIVYPGLCLIEGTNVSEGRGTEKPFLTIGAPFVNSQQLIKTMNRSDLKGYRLEPIDFIPRNIPHKAFNPKYKGVRCHGVLIHVTNRNKFNSVDFGIWMLYSLHKLYPKQFKFKSWINKLFGNYYLKEMILASAKPREIIARWKKDIEKFRRLRKQYLLY